MESISSPHKLFKTKAEALQFLNKLLSGRLETQAEKALGDNLRLNDLIHKWYVLHGRSLKSAFDTKNRLLKLSKHLKNPNGRFINPEFMPAIAKTVLTMDSCRVP